ncbi:O-acyltransferase like protein isoform X2 [Electrophorus electricus]|uniref:O-acyltransferase like protein isoform X2 n=1 Tax=Electrophorus electricus TaxID=8005 RepID=UPI0015D03CF7|nr:O-acyltransferase like protein isoform X2 [Electrophorus electricus]
MLSGSSAVTLSAILGLLLPGPAVRTLNVTAKCLQDTIAFLTELDKDTPEEYAALMFDAFGKPGSDVTGGNVNQVGSLTECLSVQGPGFKGQYCQLFLKQGAVEYFVGICVPDSCDEEEVKTLVFYEKFKQGHISLISPVPALLLSDPTLDLLMTQCVSTYVTLDLSAIVCLCVCMLMMALPLAASAYVAVMRWRRRGEVRLGVDSTLFSNPALYGALLANHSREEFSCQDTSPWQGINAERDQEQSVTSGVVSYLQAFSVQASSVAVLGTVGVTFSSLNGIRVLSLLWVVCGHTVQLSAYSNLDNSKRWKETVASSPLYVFAFSGPVYLAVDTFLLLGGLLSAKSLLSSIQRSGDILSLRLVAYFLFKRFKRVQPLHLFMVCLIIALFSVLQRGVFWFIAEDEVVSCKKYWWSNLLLVNNLFTITNICAPWTWYLSIDFQFYVTTPLVIFLYRLNKCVMVAVATVLLVTSVLAGAMVTVVLCLPVHQPTTLTHENYFQYYYNKPYTRYGPYLLGMLAGLYMTTKTEGVLKHRWQAAAGWLSSLSAMALLVGLAYALKDVPPHVSLARAVYQGLHRSVWALALVWIILACEEGYGGVDSSVEHQLRLLSGSPGSNFIVQWQTGNLNALYRPQLFVPVPKPHGCDCSSGICADCAD